MEREMGRHVASGAHNGARRTPARMLSEKKPPRVLVGQYDYAIMLSVILLVLFGVIMIFSASYYSAANNAGVQNNMYHFLQRQLLWAAVGFCTMFFVSGINYRTLRKFTLPVYLLSIFFLVLVLFIGEEINGAKRWIQVPGVGQFQPSEFAKLAMTLFLSNFLYSNKDILKNVKGFLVCSLIVIVPTVLIAVENMSTAVVFAAIGLAIIFLASTKIWYFVPVALLGVGGALFMLTANFRSARLAAWRDPFSDPLGKGFQTIQALYAIASGGLFGLGLGNSRQKLGYIPEAHTDIIFAIVCEELGLFGAALLVFLFCVLIWRCIRVAVNAIDLFGCLVAAGVAVLVGVQVVINIGVVTNTLPNTGIPLPFISYGGSSLTFVMFLMGVVLNISRYARE